MNSRFIGLCIYQTRFTIIYIWWMPVLGIGCRHSSGLNSGGIHMWRGGAAVGKRITAQCHEWRCCCLCCQRKTKKKKEMRIRDLHRPSKQSVRNAIGCGGGHADGAVENERTFSRSKSIVGGRRDTFYTLLAEMKFICNFHWPLC